MENFDDLFSGKKEEEVKKFDLEEWKEKKKGERESLFSLLEEATLEAVSSEKSYMKFLDAQAAFIEYSAGNVLLIKKQNPDATRIEDFGSWHDSNVRINEGEKSISIFEPTGEYERSDGTIGISTKIRHMFDISQTTAASSPGFLYERDRYSLRTSLQVLASQSPVEIIVHDRSELPENSDGTYNESRNEFWIAKGLEGEQIYRTLAFEIVSLKMSKDGFEDPFAASSAAYIICRRAGIDPGEYDFSGVAEKFEGKSTKEIRHELSNVRLESYDMINNMENMLEKAGKKELEGSPAPGRKDGEKDKDEDMNSEYDEAIL